LIRREFWENRAIWILPTVIGAVLTLAALFGRLNFDIPLASPDQHRVVGGTVLFAFGITFFVVMSIYSSWYLLDCLYADRKDRSILFWKSLPISDTATVLAKLFTGLIAIPLVYFAVADVTTLLIAFIVSVRAYAIYGAALWQPDLWLQLQVLWIYLIVTSALWYLPFVGWLLVVSAWAKRAVMLWSILPPLALYFLERWFFGTHVVGSALADRAFGYGSRAFAVGTRVTTDLGAEAFSAPASVWSWLDPVGFLSSPAMWAGIGVGMAFIGGAIQLRMRRAET
jgi:ABC-2 type transport system permease protein